MKHTPIRTNASAEAADVVARQTRPRHAKLALVRPVVAPVEEYVPAPADPRDAFESSALTVMREFQRFTFYR